MKIRPNIVTLLTCCVLTASALAQADTAKSNPPPSYITSYFTNGIAMVKASGTWNREQWFETGGLIAITGALVPMDEVLNIPFENWKSGGGRKFGEAGDIVGNLPLQFGITGAALAVGYMGGNKSLQHFGLDNLQAQLYTGGITFLVKELFHRARPETGEGNFSWYGPFKGNGNESFFSGHTSLSFATATMIFLHSQKKWWVGLLCYSIATGVGISRMQQQQHWASDVVAGALVGTAVSSFVYRQQEKRRSVKSGLKLIP